MAGDMPTSRTALPPGAVPRILLLEDDAGVRRSLHLLLRAHGYDVRAHASAELLLADPQAHAARHFVADYQLPDGDGVGVLGALLAAGWVGRAVLITAYLTEALCEAALAAGYAAVLEKPVRVHDLLNALLDEAAES